MGDLAKYRKFQKQNFEKWEAMCGNCGACCGALDDPCEHLRKKACGGYYCDIYDKRYGMRKTVSGKKFKCVNIREILHERWKGDECCGYKKELGLI